MNHMTHRLDLGSTEIALELFAEEQELGESLQHCCYACASTAACGSCPAGCVTTFSTFSSECCGS